MRRKLLAANWKLYKNIAEAGEYAEAFQRHLAALKEMKADLAICAPCTILPALSLALEGSGVGVGAQNVSEYVEGAYTGEIGIRQLEGLGLSFVILGHSERRNVFGETDAQIRKKLELVLGLTQRTPILCVGEKLETRQAGEAEAFTGNQLTAALFGLDPGLVARTVIAYEPIWAIGTGVNATPEDAQAMCAFIRKKVGEIAGGEIADAVRILYGGSIKPTNWAEIVAGQDVDGGLVGGASLDHDSFFELYKITAAAAG